MFIFSAENLVIQHIQRSINPQCYGQQLISVHEMIKEICNCKLIFIVYGATEIAHKTTSMSPCPPW